MSKESQKNILFVDDEIGALTLVGIVLERGGFHVLKAGNSISALAILDKETPDLIILDVMMPGDIDGIDLCEIIREREDMDNVPVLILSARGDVDSVSRGMEAGADDYLPKPTLHHNLARIAWAWISGEASSRPEVDEWINLHSRYTEDKLEARGVSDQEYVELRDATFLTGPILHDIHNTLGALEAFLMQLGRDTRHDDIRSKELRLNIVDAILLAHDLSELRFCPRWQPDTSHLCEILQEGVEIANLREPDRVIQFVQSDENSGEEIFGDRHQLLQLFANLLTWYGNLTGCHTLSIRLAVPGMTPISRTSAHVTLHAKQIGSETRPANSPERDNFLQIIVSKLLMRQQGELSEDAEDPDSFLQIIISKLLMRQQGELSEDAEDPERHRLILSLDLDPVPGCHERMERVVAHLSEEILKLEEICLQRRETIADTTSSGAPMISNVGNVLMNRLLHIAQLINDLAGERADNPPYRAMQRSGRFAILLVSNLLTVTSKSISAPKELDLLPLLEDAVLLVENKIIEDIEVRLEADEGLPNIYADETRLLQVFTNLLINALEAISDDEGAVVITAKPRDAYVKVDVSDTGKGIDQENISRIFDLHYSTKRGQQRGTGLYVVKSIMDDIGGRIEVSSEVDNGTTFTLWIPEVSNESDS